VPKQTRPPIPDRQPHAVMTRKTRGVGAGERLSPLVPHWEKRHCLGAGSGNLYPLAHAFRPYSLRL
jgi:hypothetical protein